MPRAKIYRSASERARAWRIRLEAAGGARKYFLLSPEANAALQRLTAAAGATETAVIEGLLIRAAKRRSVKE